MQISFTKMQGCGNDYLFLDARSGCFRDPSSLARLLSDRHTGVGSDGIILITDSEVADVGMRIFNSDGSEGKMCGNGIRCLGKLCFERGIVRKRTLSVETAAGIRRLFLTGNGDTVSSVTVDMGAPVFTPSEIPFRSEVSRAIGYPVLVAGRTFRINALSMGNPHNVLFLEENFPELPTVDALDLCVYGKVFQRDPLFPEGVNTEFAEVLSRYPKETLRIRVYERGSGETLACGTGACASAVAAVEKGIFGKNRDIRVLLRGGVLTVRYTDETVFLTGPAVTVFEGNAFLS